ncbi:MAG: ATP-binding cassette domain-containing protein [Bacteroidales bacterium]|nr:ATP-binding cassette domain-containing protein [Bacteroidales bacterium]MBO7379399.1 ATP-binding cassette domain-containing protein [Bacteroidales bacterium]
MYIEVKDVCKQYAGHVAVDHVSLSVPDGSIYGLLGPNGAGKTSLIRIINRITHADSGEVLMHGQPMTDDDVRRIGYMPEERGLYKKMKVGDQILYLARLRGMKARDAEAAMDEWLERFELTEWKNKKLEQLSKGMAQKVQFISTVIHRPPLLIFDEPFSGFDPVNADILKREILRLRDEGAAILFSTHNMSSVEEICEQITLINHAKVVLQGEVNQIRQQFKKNILEVTTADGQSFNYSLQEGETMHDAIARLNEEYQLTGFREILPSMHEVFVESVKSSNYE